MAQLYYLTMCKSAFTVYNTNIIMVFNSCMKHTNVAHVTANRKKTQQADQKSDFYLSWRRKHSVYFK